MKYYNTVEGVKRYRDHPYLSQSQLKYKGKGKENLGMVLGTYLDYLITMPNETDILSIIPSKRPSKAIQSLLLKYKKTFNRNPLEKHLEEFLLGESSFYPNLVIEKRVVNFLNKGKEWYDFLLENEDKVIVSEEEKDTIDIIKNNVLELLLPYEEEIIFFQKDFYWWDEEHQLGFKGLADILIITREGEMIEIDLKYTEAQNIDAWTFICKDLMYPIQKAFYKRGLTFLLPSISKGLGVPITKFSSYWLVASENFTELIPVTDMLMEIGYFGYEKPKQLKLMTNPPQEINSSFTKKGIIQLIEEFKEEKKEDFENKFINLL